MRGLGPRAYENQKSRLDQASPWVFWSPVLAQSDVVIWIKSQGIVARRRRAAMLQLAGYAFPRWRGQLAQSS